MSSCLYSLGGLSGTPQTISSHLTLSTTLPSGQGWTIESLVLAATTTSTGSVTCTLSIDDTPVASHTETLDVTGDKIFLVDFTGGGALPGPISLSGGQELSLAFSLGQSTSLLGADPSSQELGGFGINPNVITQSGTTWSPYVLVSRASPSTGSWSLSQGSVWPTALLTRVRTETSTPSFFSTVPLQGSQWTYDTTLTRSKLASNEANGAFYFPPLRMPASLVEGEGVVFGCNVGAASFSLLMDANALIYQSDTTVIQPRVQVDINEGGSAFVLGEAFQAYQDFEGFPLESLINPVLRAPSSGRTLLGADDAVQFFLYRSSGASSDWSYDPYFGTCVTFNPQATNLLRLYSDVEEGAWGWNYGPAATNLLLSTLANTHLTGSKTQGFLEWPTLVAPEIYSTTEINNTQGVSSSLQSITAPLSTCHRTAHSITWGTGVLGSASRYAPLATSTPYSVMGKVTVSAYDGVTSWTATNATSQAPVFTLGNLNAQTEGNGVLLVPHYIDRAEVYSYTTNTSVYTQFSEAQVLAGGLEPEDGKVTVAPVNLLAGTVTNMVEGRLWATRLAELASHPSIQIVATSSLHMAELGAACSKEVMIMKFGDRVVGSGLKFKDFIESYTSEEAFVYEEPKTFVVDPPELASFTLANFQGRTTYRALYGEHDRLRATYGLPYQGFLGYSRYTLE